MQLVLFLSVCVWARVLTSAVEPRLLDSLGEGDLGAVKYRLEDEKARRLLLQNDMEAMMLKVAELERQLGLSEAAHPLAMASQIQSIKSEVDAMKQTVARLQDIWTAGSGATYIRWGRTTCPENGTETVYSGYAAGGHFTHAGAAVNYLCLSAEPLWGEYLEGAQDIGALLYGAEYEFDGRNSANFFGKTLLNHDAPCAFCRTPRSSILMIPGRNLCYEGWNLEYTGYLVGGHHGHTASSEFVCLDLIPETIIGGEKNDNGKLFYFAEARCGSLKCPPYINGRELTCVVCSR